MAKKTAKAAAPAAPVNPLDALNALATGAAPAPAKKNGDKCVVIDPKPVEEQVAAWTTANQQLKEAEAVKEQAELAIREYAEPKWKEACKREGAVKKSAHVGTISIAWKSGSQMFSRGSLNLAAVKTAMGDQFDANFNVVQGPYQLLDEATQDQEFIGELAALVGKYAGLRGKSYLVKQDKCEPKDSLYEQRCLDPEKFAAIDGKLKAVGVKDQKPSFSAR